MKRSILSWLAGIIMILAFISILTIIIYSQIYSNTKIKECDKLKGTCEYYDCLADGSQTYGQETNLLLKYQNCLLKEKK